MGRINRKEYICIKGQVPGSKRKKKKKQFNPVIYKGKKSSVFSFTK